jgi:hypothetical protein
MVEAMEPPIRGEAPHGDGIGDSALQTRLQATAERMVTLADLVK